VGTLATAGALVATASAAEIFLEGPVHGTLVRLGVADPTGEALPERVVREALPAWVEAATVRAVEAATEAVAEVEREEVAECAAAAEADVS
jgi:hypothetical protein